MSAAAAKRLRWKLQERLPWALMGPRGSWLRDQHGTRYASVLHLRQGSWYWVAGWDSVVVPHNNTRDSQCGTVEEAKAAALAYVKAHLAEAL